MLVTEPLTWGSKTLLGRLTILWLLSFQSEPLPRWLAPLGHSNDRAHGGDFQGQGRLALELWEESSNLLVVSQSWLPVSMSGELLKNTGALASTPPPRF